MHQPRKREVLFLRIIVFMMPGCFLKVTSVDGGFLQSIDSVHQTGKKYDEHETICVIAYNTISVDSLCMPYAEHQFRPEQEKLYSQPLCNKSTSHPCLCNSNCESTNKTSLTPSWIIVLGFFMFPVVNILHTIVGCRPL